MEATAPRTLASKPRSGIYPTPGGGFLFVPAVDMWNLHEASKPSAICVRADVSLTVWRGIKERLAGNSRAEAWFYAWPFRRAEADSGGWELTNAEAAFRKEATIRAIIAAAPRSTDDMQAAWRGDRRPHVHDAMLTYWRRQYRDHAWFERWLLRGQEPPADVTVVTARQVRWCSRAWDFATFCRRAEVRCDSTYVLWISRGQIPDLGWLKWLYGAPPPAGAFVVSIALQKLRGEKSRKRIMRAVGLNEATFWQWEKNSLIGPILKAVLAGGDGPSMEGWDQLDPRTQRHLLEVSKAVSLKACCDRAGLSLSTYHAALGEAKRCGVKGELLHYLRMESRYAPPSGNRQSGLVAPDFFIPTPDMLKFREEARGEATKQKIWSLANLPGFDDWFRGWTAPKAHRGRRHLVAASSILASPAKELDGDLKAKAASEEKSDGASPHKPASSSPFIPTAFQERLLNALDGKSMTADALEGKMGIDRKNLYKRGINPLKAQGLIVPNRNIGYFRPDAPPPKYAKFLGKNTTSETEVATVETELATA